MNIIIYYIMCIYWFIRDIFGMGYMMYQMYLYKRHLVKRIEKNNEDISRFKILMKLYDQADIINDIV